MSPESKEVPIERNSIYNPWLWALPLGFLVIFFFFPFFRILSFSFSPDALSPPNLQLAVQTLFFTLYQALLSTLLTLLIGIPSAYLFARFDFPGRSLLRALTAVPFMLPTVVVATGFSALLGPRGWINLALMRSFGLSAPPIQFVGTLGAILLAHVFYNTTIVTRMLGNALSRLDPKLEMAARSLGADGRRVWWNLILPLLRPSMLAATLLVFLFDFTSFGVILLLGGPHFITLEVEIYVQALSFLNLPLAALLALIQLLSTLVFAVLYVNLLRRTTSESTQRSEAGNRHKPRSWREKSFVIALCAVLAALFVLPMLALPLRSISRLEADRAQTGPVQTGLTLDYYRALFVNSRGSIFYVPPVKAAIDSFAYGIATVVLSLLLGFPAASALANPGWLEKVLDPIIILPLGASAVTLGLGFIISFGSLMTYPWLVPLAHTLVALPFVIRTLQPALVSIPNRLRQAAASLGAPPFRVWQTVDWPILRRATLSAAAFAFTISLGEFGATSLLSRPEYPTLPIAIYRFLSQPGGSNFGQAMAMATLLMMITTICILIIDRLRLPGTSEF
jgi:thiamine transport system permease protein